MLSKDWSQPNKFKELDTLRSNGVNANSLQRRCSPVCRTTALTVPEAAALAWMTSVPQKRTCRLGSASVCIFQGAELAIWDNGVLVTGMLSPIRNKYLAHFVRWDASSCKSHLHSLVSHRTSSGTYHGAK